MGMNIESLGASRFVRRGLSIQCGYYPAVPLTPKEFYEHAVSVADSERRLPLSRMTGWEIFPFVADGLRVVPLEHPIVPEPPRNGEAGSPCGGCGPGEGGVWEGA